MENSNDLIKKICMKHLVSLYDVEIKSTGKGKVMIVYITKIGGVTITDCKRISREIRDTLDSTGAVEATYFLEVSSPGLERKLSQKKHYKSAINEKVKITYQENDNSKTVEGKLKEVAPDYILVENEEEVKIDFCTIKKARTVFDLNKEIS